MNLTIKSPRLWALVRLFKSLFDTQFEHSPKMSGIWRQINEFGHQFTRFAGFYSDSLEFNEENEHTALKAQVRQIQKTGGETRVRSQDQFR